MVLTQTVAALYKAHLAVVAQQTVQATANVQLLRHQAAQQKPAHVHKKVHALQHVQMDHGVAGVTAVTLMKAVACHGVVALPTVQA